MLTEPCSHGGGAGELCGCCSPCSAPRPSSFCVSPVNKTLQALGSTVTWEQGVLEQSSAVLPPSPQLPWPFCCPPVSKSSRREKNFLQITHYWGHALAWQRAPSSSTGRHLQSPQGTEPGSAQVTWRREEVALPLLGMPRFSGAPHMSPPAAKGVWEGGCIVRIPSPLHSCSPPRSCWGTAALYLLTCYVLAKTTTKNVY